MRILFVYQAPMTFVLKDLKILQGEHEVRPVRFRGLHDTPALVSGSIWADATFSWFGKLHSVFALLFSKVLGKKDVIVAGGDDVACEPEINYGMFAYWWKKWCPLFVFRYADLILSVSEFNRWETIHNAKANPAKVKLLYHGFDAAKWCAADGSAKDDLVLTVARVTDETLRKKGLDLFVRSAEQLPDIPFAIVGPWQGPAITRLRDIAPPNVTFTGGLFGEALVRVYSRAKVYVQASMHESFGCSLAEAMLCECVPVVSRRAALPEVVGKSGYYVDHLTPEGLGEQIRAALLAPPSRGKQARQRIQTMFPLETRREQLLGAVAELACH